MKSEAHIREALDALRRMQVCRPSNRATLIIAGQIEALRWVMGEGAGQLGSIDEAIKIVKEDQAARDKSQAN
jgi:hypothetical protein